MVPGSTHNDRPDDRYLVVPADAVGHQPGLVPMAGEIAGPPVEPGRNPGLAPAVAGEAAVAGVAAEAAEADTAKKTAVMELARRWAENDDDGDFGHKIDALRSKRDNPSRYQLTEDGVAKIDEQIARLEERREESIARGMAWTERLYDADPDRVDLEDDASRSRFRNANIAFVRIGRSDHAAGQAEVLVDRIAALLERPDQKVGDGVVEVLQELFRPALRYDDEGRAAADRFIRAVEFTRNKSDPKAVWKAALEEFRPRLAMTRGVLRAVADRFVERYVAGEELRTTDIVERKPRGTN